MRKAGEKGESGVGEGSKLGCYLNGTAFVGLFYCAFAPGIAV